MFDTIRMKAGNVTIEEDILNNLKSNKGVEVTNYLDTDTGEVNSRLTFRDTAVPYMVYYTNTKSLIIQVSIPKFLHDENVTLINESDIERFWNQLDIRLAEKLSIKVGREEWQVKRLDVCWNFNVGDKVSDYIYQLGLKSMPFKNTYVTNHNETVEYKNKSSRIMFYDKQKECLNSKQSKDIVLQADGVLRMEITPSYSDIKKFCSERKAANLLTKEFFSSITQPILNSLKFQSHNVGFTYEWLQHQTISRVETVIGFKLIMDSIGEKKAKEIYKANFYKRKKWLNEIVFPDHDTLSELKIDHKDIS